MAKKRNGVLILLTVFVLFAFSMSFLWYLDDVQSQENLLVSMEIEKWRSLFSIQLYMRVEELYRQGLLSIGDTEIAINGHTIKVTPEGVLFVKGE
ncbi:MAG TPA: hypothetical protein PKM99_06140 [Thermotogota bacterium]|jgi:hypothetical protein|nr:hypothetical protein [Thermotogota bacterium]MDD8054082.1 hypothetical protein [Thermotogota bacterium]HNR63558.1 hypothetical protein [Thermotogota bacterium]HNT95681.1 hypothetical protein [Thermotogota bacterium]HPM20702.1 hypothetical protein [Thermotogota bacterium]